jgi:hypothetical protein
MTLWLLKEEMIMTQTKLVQLVLGGILAASLAASSFAIFAEPATPASNPDDQSTIIIPDVNGQNVTTDANGQNGVKPMANESSDQKDDQTVQNNAQDSNNPTPTVNNNGENAYDQN